MFQIQTITRDAKQKQTLLLTDGTQILFQIYYCEMQVGWFIKSMVCNGFEMKGLRIVNSPNMLHQFRNLIPFGLACFSDAEREPNLITDFSSGLSKLYILSETEVEEYTRFLTNG